jgi:hypothetical protein
MSRIYIAAVDVHRGDDVVFTMHWTASIEHRLALDSCVWIDRKDPITMDGAA